MGGMRVLVCYEESHRSYGETTALALRWLRPGAEVSVARAENLAEEVARLHPHLVVCNRANEVDAGGRAAWARVSTEPDEPSEFCVGGRRRKLKNPGFKEVLGFFDEAEELVLGGQKVCGC